MSSNYTDSSIQICFSSEANVAQEKETILFEGFMRETGSAKPNSVIRVTSANKAEELFGKNMPLTESIKLALDLSNGLYEVYALPRIIPGEFKPFSFVLDLSTPKNNRHGKMRFYTMHQQTFQYDLRSMGLLGLDLTKLKMPFNIEKVPSENTDAQKDSIAFKFTSLTPSVNPPTDHFISYIGSESFDAPENVEKVIRDIQFNDNPFSFTPNYQEIFGNCCYDAHVLVENDFNWQESLVEFMQSRWDCKLSPCHTEGYIYSVSDDVKDFDSLRFNAKSVSVMALRRSSSVVAPYLKLTSYASISKKVSVIDPSMGVYGSANGGLEGILEISTCKDGWDKDESEYLIDSGFVILGVPASSTTERSRPYVISDITNYIHDDQGRPNDTFKQATSRRAAKVIFREIYDRIRPLIAQPIYDSVVPEGASGVTPATIKSEIQATMQSLYSSYVSNEDDTLKIEVKKETDTMPKCMGSPNKLIINISFVLLPRIREVRVNVSPVVRNCGVM